MLVNNSSRSFVLYQYGLTFQDLILKLMNNWRILGLSFIVIKSSQVNTLPKAKSKARCKQNKDMHKCSSVYSERGVPLPVLTSGGE